MKIEPTFCSACDHVHGSTRKMQPHAWRCSRFPILAGFSPVDPDYLPEPPFNRCENVNKGFCPCFAPRRRPADSVAAESGELEMVL